MDHQDQRAGASAPNARKPLKRSIPKASVSADIGDETTQASHDRGSDPAIDRNNSEQGTLVSGTRVYKDSVHGNVNRQFNAGVVHYSQPGFVMHHDFPVVQTVNLAVTAALEARLQAQTKRRSSNVPSAGECYVPYVDVKDVKSKKVRTSLHRMAKSLQFLDEAFAEYFQLVIRSHDLDYIERRLADARARIKGTQSLDVHQSAWLGDLGQYCELVANRATGKFQRIPFKSSIARAGDTIQYLQDAYEVPYWEIILDLFLISTANQKGMASGVVLRVLQSIKLDVLEEMGRLKGTLATLSAEEAENIAPLLKGTEARLAILEDFWDPDTSHDERDELLANLFSRSLTTSSTESNVDGGIMLSLKQNQLIYLMGLVLIFVVLWFPFGCIGFYYSMSAGGKGSVHDADFWWLIQSSTMAILGSLMSIVPLVTESWLSPAYTLTWLCFVCSLISAGLSIAIYPFMNTAWSSAASSVGALFSAFSVLAMTQASTKQATYRSKVKKE